MKEKSYEQKADIEQYRLLQETMKRMDVLYDEDAKMLGNDVEGHGVRVTAHYAVGLLARGEAGDMERAAAVLCRLLDMQFGGDPEDAFYGCFPRNDREGQPSGEPFPGQHFTALHRYYLEKWQETILANFKRRLMEEGYEMSVAAGLCQSYEKALADTLPVVWKSFDPNWREFIGTDIAMILALYEENIDKALAGRLKEALERAVSGSVTRYRNHVCPMNTNIELMHIFICAFLAERKKDNVLLEHALAAAERFERDYKEFHSVAEYNSTTYYSVDLMALAAWRLLENEKLRSLGNWLEAEIWKDIAVMYHPLLKNLCPPYSRSYELDMRLHSLLPALLYLGLGEEHQPMPEFNCELAGNIAIAILGTRIPKECKRQLTVFTKERQVETRFRELMERSHPEDDTSVCTATAWIAEDYMLGALKGSRNTSGQLRSAAAFWRAPDGTVSNMALVRREPGEACEHLRTVFFDNSVEKNHMEIKASWDLKRDLELVFVVMAQGLEPEMFGASSWMLPGMTVLVKDGGRKKELRRIPGGMEVVYFRPWTAENEEKAEFTLDFITIS